MEKKVPTMHSKIYMHAFYCKKVPKTKSVECQTHDPAYDQQNADHPHDRNLLLQKQVRQYQREHRRRIRQSCHYVAIVIFEDLVIQQRRKKDQKYRTYRAQQYYRRSYFFVLFAQQLPVVHRIKQQAQGICRARQNHHRFWLYCSQDVFVHDRRDPPQQRDEQRNCDEMHLYFNMYLISYRIFPRNLSNKR